MLVRSGQHDRLVSQQLLPSLQDVRQNEGVHVADMRS